MNTDQDKVSLDKTHLFTKQIVQNDIKKSWYEHLDRLDTGKGSKVLKFNIPGNEYYIETSETILFLTLKIVKGNGENIADGAAVAPQNNIGINMFSQLRIYFREQLYDNIKNYNIAGCLETELSYSEDAKKTWLTAGVYSADDAGEEDDLTGKNSGFKTRQEIFAKSKEVEICTKIHSGFFHNHKLFINNCDMTLEFDIENNDKILMCASEGNTFEPYKLEIVNAKLLIRRVTLESDKDVQIQKMLSQKPISVPVHRSYLWTHTIIAGGFEYSISNFTRGDLPVRIFVGMVSADRANGSYSLNTMKFEHFDLNGFDILVDGVSTYGKETKCNFPEKKFGELYINTLKALGFYGGQICSNINRDNFANGKTILGMDLTTSFGDGLFFNDPIRLGTISIKLSFSKPLPKAVTIYTYCQYSCRFNIDDTRTLKTDWN